MAIALQGCAASSRNPVPSELVSRVQVVGFSDVRDFGDGFSPTLQASLVESFRQNEAFDSPAGVDDEAPVSILALSGGGADGAFGAGLLCGWSAAETRPAFRIVTGISTGALIAPFAFLGPAQDESLRRVYTTISTKDIYREKSIVEVLFSSDSLLDTEALADLIVREIDESMLAAIGDAHRQGRRLFIGTTNMDAGKLVIWDMGAIAASGRSGALKLFRDVMRASSAIPLAFPAVHFPVTAEGKVFEEMHADGGVTARVFLYGFALDWKLAERESGVTPRPTHLYVVCNGQIARSWRLSLKTDAYPTDSTTKGLIGVQVVGDLYRIYAVASREGIDFNLACIPDDFIPAGRESFDRAEMNRLFNLAFESATSGYRWQRLPPGLRPAPAETGSGGRVRNRSSHSVE